MQQVKKAKIIVVSLVGLAVGLMTYGCGSKKDAGDVTLAKPYPLKVCLVSGEPLGSMGEPVSLVHAGQEIKFCCKDCVEEFKGEPAKFMAKLSNPPAPEAESDEQ